MNMINRDFSSSLHLQQGVALITGLIFMVILTLLGITAARMAGLEERMSGNMRDRSLAMQAAEMALRDAEQDILKSGRILGLTKFLNTCNFDGTLNTNDDGLCDRRGTAPITYTNTTITFSSFIVLGVNYPALTLDMTAAPSVAYATNTVGAPPITGVSAPPRYIIEGLSKQCWPPECGELSPGYRITVRAQGANSNTVVWLQEIFRP